MLLGGVIFTAFHLNLNRFDAELSFRGKAHDELARVLADPKLRPPRKGVGIYVTSRFALFKHAFTSPNDSVLIQVPPPGFTRVKVTPFYSAYVAC